MSTLRRRIAALLSPEIAAQADELREITATLVAYTRDLQVISGHAHKFAAQLAEARAELARANQMLDAERRVVLTLQDRLAACQTGRTE